MEICLPSWISFLAIAVMRSSLSLNTTSDSEFDMIWL